MDSSFFLNGIGIRLPFLNPIGLFKRFDESPPLDWDMDITFCPADKKRGINDIIAR